MGLEPRTLPSNPTKNSNELLKRKPKPRLLWLTLSRPADTTTTCSENSTKKNKKLKPNSSDLCPKPTLKSLLGEPSTKLMPSSELKSLKKPRRSSPLNSRRWKNSSNPPKPNALLLKRPKSDSLAKLKIFKSILNEPTLPLLPSTKNSETSIKSSLNTNRKKKNSRSNSNLPRKRPDPCPPNCSRPRTLMKKLLTALKPSNEKTRTCKKKLPILPINSVKVANPSTSWKKPNDLWNKSETNFKLLLKKPKVPSKSKKLKFSDSPSKCPRTNRTSNDDWLRKKKRSTPPDETVSELLNPCKLPWTLNPK